MTLNSFFLEAAIALCDEMLEGKKVIFVSDADSMDQVHKVMGMVFENYDENQRETLKNDLPIIFIKTETTDAENFVTFIANEYPGLKGYLSFGLTDELQSLLSHLVNYRNREHGSL